MIEHRHCIRHVSHRIVVGIDGRETSAISSTAEEITENRHSIGDVDGLILIRISTKESRQPIGDQDDIGPLELIDSAGSADSECHRVTPWLRIQVLRGNGRAVRTIAKQPQLLIDLPTAQVFEFDRQRCWPRWKRSSL